VPWVTPQAFDASNDGKPRALRYKGNHPSEKALNSNRDPNRIGSYRGDLKDWAALAAWATPTARDWKDGKDCLNVPVNCLLGRQVWGSGPLANGSNAEMDASARLNPELPRWLMGFPKSWVNCVPTETR
jgi:hypothetical protein